MSIELVVFDCDGVLFHSERANIAFYDEVLRRAGESGLPQTAEVAAHALASAQLFEKFYGDRPETLEHVRRVAKTVDYGPFYDFMEPREQLRETLTGLRENYATAMATNRGKTTHEVLARFELTSLFDLAVGVLDVERPKPHPDMLLHCLEHFGVAADDAVYVGDQETDALAAKAAGMRFIGTGPARELSEFPIDELFELPAVLAGL